MLIKCGIDIAKIEIEIIFILMNIVAFTSVIYFLMGIGFTLLLIFRKKGIINSKMFVLIFNILAILWAGMLITTFIILLEMSKN